MMLDNFIKEFSKDKEKKKKVSGLGNVPHGSEALIISKISEYIKKDLSPTDIHAFCGEVIILSVL